MNTLTLRRIIETSKGLLKIEPKVRASDAYSLSLIYTPGVSFICFF
jgi:malic enzyme